MLIIRTLSVFCIVFVLSREAMACESEILDAASTPPSYVELCQQGIALSDEGELRRAAATYANAANEAQDDIQRSGALHAAGVAYREAGDLLSARYSIEQSLESALRTKDAYAKSRAYNGLAGIRNAMNDYAGALASVSLAIDQAELAYAEAPQDDRLRLLLIRMSLNKAQGHTTLSEHDQADTALDRIRDLIRESDPERLRRGLRHVTAWNRIAQGRLSEAENMLSDVFKLAEKEANPVWRYSLLQKMAVLYEEQGRGSDMLAVTDIMSDLEDTPSIKPYVLEYRARALQLLGKHQEASGVFKQYGNALEAHFIDENARELARFESAFEARNREREIDRLSAANAASEAALSRQRLTLALGSVIAGLLLLVLFLLELQRRTRQKLVIDNARREAALQERSRVAGDVHDTLLQSLIAVGMEARSGLSSTRTTGPGRALESIQDLVQQGASDVRRAISAYRQVAPSSLDWQQVRHEIGEAARTPFPDVDVRVEVEGRGTGPFDAARIADLHMIVREAVSNAVKHGEPPVAVRLEADGTELSVEVSDGGSGIPVNGPADGAQADHFGLQVMRERASRSNLRLDFGASGASRVRVGGDLGLP